MATSVYIDELIEKRKTNLTDEEKDLLRSLFSQSQKSKSEAIKYAENCLTDTTEMSRQIDTITTTLSNTITRKFKSVTRFIAIDRNWHTRENIKKVFAEVSLALDFATIELHRIKHKAQSPQKNCIFNLILLDQLIQKEPNTQIKYSLQTMYNSIYETTLTLEDMITNINIVIERNIKENERYELVGSVFNGFLHKQYGSTFIDLYNGLPFISWERFLKQLILSPRYSEVFDKGFIHRLPREYQENAIETFRTEKMTRFINDIQYYQLPDSTNETSAQNAKEYFISAMIISLFWIQKRSGAVTFPDFLNASALDYKCEKLAEEPFAYNTFMYIMYSYILENGTKSNTTMLDSNQVLKSLRNDLVYRTIEPTAKNIYKVKGFVRISEICNQIKMHPTTIYGICNGDLLFFDNPVIEEFFKSEYPTKEDYEKLENILNQLVLENNHDTHEFEKDAASIIVSTFMSTIQSRLFQKRNSYKDYDKTIILAILLRSASKKEDYGLVHLSSLTHDYHVSFITMYKDKIGSITREKVYLLCKLEDILRYNKERDTTEIISAILEDVPKFLKQVFGTDSNHFPLGSASLTKQEQEIILESFNGAVEAYVNSCLEEKTLTKSKKRPPIKPQ